MMGVLYGGLAAICFGIMPVLTKLVYGSTHVDPFFFLMIRYVIAAILIWGYIFLKKDQTWREVTRTQIGLIIVVSLCYIMVTAAYFVGLQFIDASLNSLLVFTFPVFTPILGWVFFKQKFSWLQVVAALVGFLGCLLVIGNYRLKGIPGEILGIGLGLGSGLLYALYTLLGQRITVRMKPLTVTAYNLTIVAAFFVCSRITWIGHYQQPGQVYLAAAVIAVISTILSNIFYFKAIQSVGAVKAGIFSSMEPFFTAILAIILLGEHLDLLQWAGALFIVGSMIIIQAPWRTKPKATAGMGT